MNFSPFLAGLAAIAGSLAVPLTAAARTTAPATPYYLALGDSIPVWDGLQSYPYLIVSHQARANLQLVSMACSGETTSTMIEGSYCGGSQLEDAIDFLDANRGNVALITIDIGGNDLYYCTDAADPVTCAVDALATMESNLTSILAGLRSAAGPGVPIVGMNYFDPLLGDWLFPDDSTLVGEAIAIIPILNTDLKQVYSEAGSPVADVYKAFRTSDMNLVRSPWGRVPLAVKKACTLLDYVPSCQQGQTTSVFGTDPNDAGAVVIAQAFDKVIRLHRT